MKQIFTWTLQRGEETKTQIQGCSCSHPRAGKKSEIQTKDYSQAFIFNEICCYLFFVVVFPYLGPNISSFLIFHSWNGNNSSKPHKPLYSGST